jgi:Family of unknown function (DUF6760)
MRPPVRGRSRRWSPGGVVTWPEGRLFEEIAYVAYHFHWPFEAILDLEHPLRTRFVDEIGHINRRLSAEV